MALFRMHRQDEALIYTQRAIQSDPEYAEAHYNLGCILGLQGDLVQASQEYERALKLKPDSAQAHHQLALVLQKQNKVADAIVHYQDAVRLDPKDEQAKQQLRALRPLAPE